LKATVINANSKDIKLMHVLIGSHQLMVEEPPILEEEAEDEDLEAEAELDSKETVRIAESKVTWNGSAG
jgi:hypothetical protein